MKVLLITVVILSISFSQASAAFLFGSGPWANGAYYPGQFDGIYTASIFASPGNDGADNYTGTVIGGVVGFALTGGAPRTIGDPPAIDTSKNFYVIFANGVTFAGVTTANIDINTKKVSGVFGASDFTSAAGNTEDFFGGAFIANIDSYKAQFTFSGNGMINTSPAPLAGAPIGPTDGIQFQINGIKTAN